MPKNRHLQALFVYCCGEPAARASMMQYPKMLIQQLGTQKPSYLGYKIITRKIFAYCIKVTILQAALGAISLLRSSLSLHESFTDNFWELLNTVQLLLNIVRLRYKNTPG
jgi:hypothetical protein